MTYLKDLAERVVATYLEALLGLLAASTYTDWLSLSFWQSAAVAAIPAALSVIKGALAKLKGDPETASLVETA